MRKSMILKGVAIVLAAVALLAAVAGGCGMILMGEQELYTKSVPQLKAERMDRVTVGVAEAMVKAYIRDNFSDMTEEALNHSGFYNGHDYYWYEFNDDLGAKGWYYSILDRNGKVLESSGNGTPPAEFVTYTQMIQVTYPKLVRVVEVKVNEPEDTTEATIPGMEEDAEPTTKPITELDADECMRWYNYDTETYYDYYFDHVESPDYEVRISLPKDYSVTYRDGYWEILELVSSLRYVMLPCLLIGLAVFAVSMVYLVAAAGHSRASDQVRAGGLNRLPLDLYVAVAAGGVFLLTAAGVVLIDWMGWRNAMEFGSGILVLSGLCFLGAAVLVVACFFAAAAQFKTPGGFWWRNSAIGFVLRMLGRGCRWLWRAGIRLFSVLGTVWQWGLVGVALCFGWFLVVLWGDFLPFLFMLAVTAAVVAYGAYAFGVLLEGARRMAKGDLNRKINGKLLIGCFADCAGSLNALADVAVVAAQKQLKSDRMKTELITNVSHDIKTPLTSIINYVDLLQKPHTQAEGEEYLAVLARQSNQMKKLIEDLMDMSKATTGNMAVEIIRMDAVEAVNQALGEFSDKLAAVPLIPVVRCPEGPVMVRADGRLLWRTLSNLLQNAAKYALPGTRLYVDVIRADGDVVISLKNISREELNISADELMERFVRGDTSRNTEGSGLGLNIAKSLMELQRGQLQVLVDGDLFKASLIIPGAE